jgi:hypothetical protein
MKNLKTIALKGIEYAKQNKQEIIKQLKKLRSVVNPSGDTKRAIRGLEEAMRQQALILESFKKINAEYKELNSKYV